MECKTVAAVILDNTSRTFDKIYNYLVPLDMSLYLETGMRILVPFGKADNQKVAYFLDFVPYTEKLKNIKMKYIAEILDDEAVLSKNMFILAKEIRDEYFCTYGQVLNSMVPLGLKISIEKLILQEDGTLTLFQTYLKSLAGGITELNQQLKTNSIKIVEQGVRNMKKKVEKAARLKITSEEVMDLVYKDIIKNEKHIRVLDLLSSYDEITVNDFSCYENISKNILSTLAKKGYIEIFEKPKRQDMVNEEPDEAVPSDKIPTPEQVAVTNTISLSVDKGIYDKYLIHGVTGSGKTEVYLNLAEKVINKDRNVIVLVPEIALTPMMVKRFTLRFGNNLEVMHSRLSMKERYNAWMKIKRGEVKIALGTRSCIFAPFDKLGLIIIDEEHDSSYISESTPKYHTNFVANKRAQMENAVLVLGSATPKITTYNAFEKKGHVLSMSNRALGKLPSVSLVDMREDAINGKMSVFSTTLLNEISRNLNNKEQTVLFLNKRGYSSIQLCTACKAVVKCEHCDVPLTYHKGRNYLICHYCGHMQRKSDICTCCHETAMMECGSGTEKCETQLQEMFPEASIIRMDLDTTGMKNSHKDILERFENEKIDILIGTQMIAKGHDYPLVTLVGILNADALGAGAFYESNENAYQLITQSAGRAGRSDLKGRAIIQAYNVDSPLMENAIKQDYQSFYLSELKIRKTLELPPFTNMAFLIFSSVQQHLSEEYADMAYRLLSKTSMTIYAPSKPQIGKLNDRFRTRIIVKHKDTKEFMDNITKAYLFIIKKLPKKVTMSIDVFKDEFDTL